MNTYQELKPGMRFKSVSEQYTHDTYGIPTGTVVTLTKTPYVYRYSSGKMGVIFALETSTGAKTNYIEWENAKRKFNEEFVPV